MNLWTLCLRVFYPQTCCFCGKTCNRYVCDVCKGQLPYIHEPVCEKCGKPIASKDEKWCFDCARSPHFFEQGRSLWLHQGVVRWSIYHFKYHNRRTHGEYYAKELCRVYGEWIRNREIDVIIPVPLHPKRKRIRGYNQSEILAKHLGKALHLPVECKSVVRTKATAPQKTLNKEERRRNLKDAFSVVRMPKNVKNILIIDDIYTTGSTIDALAKKLKEKGDFRVFFLSISIGQGF